MFHCWKERNEVETSPSIFPDPAGGYKYPETKNVSAILYRRSPFERPCRVADTKRLCFRTTSPFPLFGRACWTSRYRMPPVLPSVGPEATLRTPDFRLPAIRPTFIFRPLRINLSTPKIKKVANECLQPSRPPGRLRRERDSNPRYSCPYTAFRVRPDRPLRHLSRSITNPSAGNSECKYSYFSQKKHFRNKKRFEFLFSPAQCISRFYCYFCEIMTHRQ